MKRWFLVEANRLLVSGLLAGVVFVSTVLVGTFGPVSVQEFLGDGISPASAFVELLKTIVSLVTIVLSINQLVLSPQFGPVGNQYERLKEAMDLRRNTEDALNIEVNPSPPSRFLYAVTMSLMKRAEALEKTTRNDIILSEY